MPTPTFITGAALIAAVAVCLGVYAAPPAVEPPPKPFNDRQNEIANWPANAELPDPFKFNDGTRVQNATDWARRRDELKKLVLDLEYGPLPPPQFNAVKLVEETSAPSSQPAQADAAHRGIERHITLATGPEGKLLIHVILTEPQGNGPFPVIIKGDLCWGRVKPEIVATIVQRGYALAEFDRTELGADKPGRDTGVWALYPGYTGGAMSVWAWGFHRVTDYVLTLKEVDSKRVIVTGHSRGGKAVLLAGALDERVALTAPNGSGCGGGGCYRFQPPKTEDLGRITSHFPHWFELHFDDFGPLVDRLPFDQHMVKALVAPRALLTTDGLSDEWANLKGVQVTFYAAKEVFGFLGAVDRIGFSYRPGKHEHNLTDFTTLLDFADKTLTGKTVDRQFDQPQFEGVPKLYTWTTPAAK